MNKIDVINELSSKCDAPKTKIEEMLDGLIDLIISAAKRGEEETLVGFGTFSARARKGRIGINPQKPTEKITIPSVVVPKFKAGKRFKDALKK